MKDFFRDTSNTVCLHGLYEDCTDPREYVNDATIFAAVFAPNKTTELQGDVAVDPQVIDGDYKGILPVVDVQTFEFVYVRITIDKGPTFRTTIWEPRRVADRPLDS